MISPDGHIANVSPVGVALERQLGFGTILIQTGHREPSIGGNLLGVVHGDKAVRVARIADDEHTKVGPCRLGQRSALLNENLPVDAKQIFAFHSSSPGHTPNKKSPIHSAKSLIEISRGQDVVQERKRAIVQLHHHALKDFQGRRNLNQMQVDRLIRPEDPTGGNSWQK